MFVSINNRKNNLPFGITGSPGYGCPPGFLQQASPGKLFPDNASAVAELGAANVYPLVFSLSNYITLSGHPDTKWTWSWNCFVVYYSHNGMLAGLFTNQLAAQQYATKLGSGYITAACVLSTN